MAADLKRGPRQFVVRKSGEWPNCVVEGSAPAQILQTIALELQSQRDSKTFRELAREYDVGVGTITRILQGDGWLDLFTTDKLANKMGLTLRMAKRRSSNK